MAVTTDLLQDAGSSSSDGEEFMAEWEESELEDSEEEEEEEAELAEPEEETTDRAECSSAGRPPWPPAGAAVGGDMNRDCDCVDGAAAAVLLHGRGELHQQQHPWRSCSDTANSHDDDGERRLKVLATTTTKKKKSGGGLSPEALLLLQRASRSVRKNMKRARDHHKMAAPLYSHLHSLQSLLLQSDAQTSGSCVITDALSYMRYLKRQIKDIQGALRTPQPAACTSDVKVELTSMDGPSLLVKVSCEKRPGLLTELMLILERLGLVFDEVNASCHDRMSFEACTAQEGVDLLDKEILKVAIIRAISSLQKR